MNTRRVIEVAGEKAMLIDQRYAGYREDVIRGLAQVLAAQNEGLSEKGRRDRVSKIVDALGVKVATEARRQP